MDKHTYNRLVARLLYKKKLVHKEQIRACWASLHPGESLDRIMVAQGLLNEKHFHKLRNYIAKLRERPDYKKKVLEILGSRPKTPEKDDSPTGRASAPVAEAAEPEERGPGEANIPVKFTKTPLPQRVVEELPPQFKGTSGFGKLKMPVPKALSQPRDLDEVLLYARRVHASDVHLSPNSPVLMRRYGQLSPATKEALTHRAIQNIVESALTGEQLDHFKTTGDLEFAYSIEGGGRYRITLMEQRFGWELTARVVPLKIRSYEESGLPESCVKLTKWAQGLVLITGPSGCGKSSTLATLVEMINRDRDEHIITIEHPVEIVFKQSRSQITQREIGVHTLSQENALRAALRQDPDILVIGELREIEHIRLAVSAAETGHLVFATMNTANAARTINRLIDSFPPQEQDVIRNMISESLRGIISQQLVPRKDGEGMVPAFEVLVVTQAVANLIRKKNTHQLATAMMTGKADGHVVLDVSLKRMVDRGVIEGEEAFKHATEPKTFRQYAPSESRELTHGKN